MDFDQIGVAVQRLQRRVVDRLLDVHVLEVLGHEQRRMPVQAQCQREALRDRRGAQRRRLFAEQLDGVDVLEVVVGGLARAARAARLDGGVHEIVLVPEVARQHDQQLVEAAKRGTNVGLVGDVEPAELLQRGAHEAAQRLVDAAVHVEARRGGGRGEVGAGGQGGGGHGVSRRFGVCASVASAAGRHIARRSHRAEPSAG